MHKDLESGSEDSMLEHICTPALGQASHQKDFRWPI